MRRPLGQPRSQQHDALAPGETGYRQLTISAPIGTLGARYDIGVAASDGVPAHAVTTDGFGPPLQASTVPDTAAPTAPSGLSGSCSAERSDSRGSSPATHAALPVTASRVTDRLWRRPRQLPGQTPRLPAGSTYVYSVQAFDQAGNVSAPSGGFTILQVAGAGKGK